MGSRADRGGTDADAAGAAAAGPKSDAKAPRARRGLLPAGEEPSIEAARDSIEARNELILYYMPLVRFIASRVSARLPSHVEVDDLVESGVLGLIDALTKFDPGQRIKFKTYAEFRIRGAILDELRSLDWVPRSTRQKMSRLEKAYLELEQRLGRSASDAEMLEFLKIDETQFNALIAEARGYALLSLDEMHVTSEEGFEHSLIEQLADLEQLDPSQNMDSDQYFRVIIDTIDRLPENERLVVSLYYYEEMTMKEIGDLLDVTESRISQIHTKTMARIRSRLATAILGDRGPSPLPELTE